MAKVYIAFLIGFLTCAYMTSQWTIPIRAVERRAKEMGYTFDNKTINYIFTGEEYEN